MLVTGTGVVRLTRPAGNTYEGSTTISGGTLLVNNTSNSGTSTGAVFVNTGGTLGGTGFINTGTTNNGVTVSAGGKLAPGASAGVLTMLLGTGSLDVSGAVSAGNSQSLLYELDALAGANDKIVLSSATSALNIGAGTLEFDDFKFTNLGGLQDGTYVLFDTNAAIVGTLGTTISGSIDANNNGTLAFADNGKDLVLNVTSVPEPTSLALVGIGAAAALRRRRRAN
jgi:autotransporter-associated beta strand protein